MSILVKIFDGEFESVNGRRPKTPEYDVLCKKMSSEIEYLEKSISADDFKRLEKLINIIASMGRCECFETFRLGVALATEVINLQKK